MKRILLFLFAVIGVQSLTAQVLQSEDFSNLPIGPVGTDATGTIATNGYFTLSTNYDLDPLAATTATNAGPGNFQIVDVGGTNGNVLQIEGTNGNLGRRNMWQEGLGGQWAFRDPSNNKIQVEFDLFTGTGGGDSNNTKGVYIYDPSPASAGLKILGGYVFNTKTRVLQGIAYFTSPTAPIANYGFFLGPAGTNITLPENQWVRLIVSFNKTTGQVVWKGPGILGQVMGAATGLDPDQVAFISRSGSVAANGGNPAIVNAAATTAGFFDNLLVSATNVDLLATDEFIDANFEVSVYPNPASDYILLWSRDNNIRSVSMTDLNGRTVKTITVENALNPQIDLIDLSSGVYLMNVVTEKGNVTKKILKN